MAKKRRTTTRKRRRRTLSEGMGKKVRRRRSSSRRRGLLGSGGALSQANLMEAGKELIGGGIGGYAGGKIYHMTSSYTPLQKAMAFGAASLGAHLMGFKNMATGIAGSYGFAVSAGMPGMSEDEDMEEHDYTDKNALSEMPDGMDEDGEPMYLGDDGEYYYAHELEEDEDLEEDDDDALGAELLADEYPDYANVSNY